MPGFILRLHPQENSRSVVNINTTVAAGSFLLNSIQVSTRSSCMAGVKLGVHLLSLMWIINK